jgi:LPPG:FO 2-phospho-L-lactate transferase
VAALDEADLVIIGPSNPLISIAPIVEVIGAHIPRERTVAITPIVRGAALKGPTIEMMRAVGPPPTPVEVARMYQRVAGTFVLDSRDQELVANVSELGLRTLVFDTVMADGGDALGAAILEAFT